MPRKSQSIRHVLSIKLKQSFFSLGQSPAKAGGHFQRKLKVCLHDEIWSQYPIYSVNWYLTITLLLLIQNHSHQRVLFDEKKIFFY